MDNFVRDFRYMNFHVFVSGHPGSVIKILYIKCAKPGTGGGDRAVQQDFGGGEAGGLGGSRSWKVKTIAAGTILDRMGFRLGGADGCLLLAVSYLPSLGNAVLGDEENGAGAGNALAGQSEDADTLSEPAKVVGHAAEPQLAVGSFDEETIVHCLASGGMDDRVCVSRGMNGGGSVGGVVVLCSMCGSIRWYNVGPRRMG